MTTPFEAIMAQEKVIPLCCAPKILLKRNKHKSLPFSPCLAPECSLPAWQDFAEDAPEHFAKNGISMKTLRALKREKPTASLDLHGHVVESSRNALGTFLQYAQENQHRYVLIIHGQGRNSKNGIGILQQKVRIWLRQAESVLAYAPHLDNVGTTIALLKTLPR